MVLVCNLSVAELIVTLIYLIVQSRQALNNFIKKYITFLFLTNTLKYFQIDVDVLHQPKLSKTSLITST